MIRTVTQRLTMLGVLALTTAAWAQFEGLDLSEPPPAKKAAPPAAKKASEPKKAAPAATDELAPLAAPPAKAEKDKAPEKDKTADKGLELDLSTTADVKSVLILPPIVKVTSSTGGFSGFDTKKVSERFDTAAHKRLVTAFEKQLEGKVIPAELTMGVITKEGLTPASVRTPAGIEKLSKATNVAYVVELEFNKTGALVGTIYDPAGKAQGQPSYVNSAIGITQKHSDDMASFVSKELATVAKAAAAAAAQASATPVKEAPPPPPVEDDVVEAPTEFVSTSKKTNWEPDPAKPRFVVTVGPGAVARSLSVSGDRAATLAELRNNAVVGLGVYAQINPLQFMEATAGKKWSDLELEVHWRRGFASAQGLSGPYEGQKCSVTEDDIQARGTYRYKVADGTYAPTVGLGGGFSQERSLIGCALPVVSTTYRGVDVQLRAKQPLYNNMVALDLAVGPRFLMAGPSASPGFSFSGEAWVEFKPISYLFGRAGGRVSRLVVSDNTGLAIADTRMFFALEVGAFF